jgi:hypothetical protein
VSGYGGWFLLRLSLHDPVLPLNIEVMNALNFSTNLLYWQPPWFAHLIYTIAFSPLNQFTVYITIARLTHPFLETHCNILVSIVKWYDDAGSVTGGCSEAWLSCVSSCAWVWGSWCYTTPEVYCWLNPKPQVLISQHLCAQRLLLWILLCSLNFDMHRQVSWD